MSHPFRAKSVDPVALRLLVEVSPASLAGPRHREDDDGSLGDAEAHQLVAERWLKMLRDLEGVSEVERSRGFDNALLPEVERPSVHSLASASRRPRALHPCKSGRDVGDAASTAFPPTADARSAALPGGCL
jgi:hypothetical protein